MKKPIIGITANQRLNIALDDLPWTYAPAGFSEAVIKSGATPLLLPIGDEEAAKTYVSLVDKIIIIGGQNVDPQFYNEEKAAYDDDFLLERDLFEMAIIEEAMKQNKPVLGICRGMQLMNVFLGGSLHQNIANHWQHAPSDSLNHSITIEAESFLQAIYGDKPFINSFHHQSIKVLAKDLKVIAFDPRDETIEAVVSTNPKIPFIGVQWHPELLQAARQEDLRLFDYFINEFTS
ncbi:gamma-glutamyl-gamma-aminobutyrate hydrolase family protein [Streptococcus uberis]|uniref:gamma-glutamyl-gamma-aminobutyrate hydrolase family protein n=1 Tax=Streptococcus uberis TaxID=1349 RepID=UPI0012B5091F|nr:gamma-glutamyl-gamma-aminobutyrate hydrolase family protein [Streptococcus uberis]MTB62411.1 gamma-glutamyl-gamma-aminobutyrate hydrolase family protein [Streptococcus uberis]MTB93285.1 gamma-glutamyl-gamma-aminobutyrate hydrolase family protein [Streptococcus uberis]MTC89338.1 gamma-glutamyl-gamma-aminobutyrate hydrolase family protein [Streptococcus uberis]